MIQRIRALAVISVAFGWTSVHASGEPPPPIQCQANETLPPDERSPPLDRVVQKPLFDDWPPRQHLAEQGVMFIAQFIAEPAENDRGYHGSGWAYAQDLEFGTVLNMKKLGWSDDGVIRAMFSDRLGPAVQQDKTGAYIQNQAYWGQGQTFRFDEISFERSFLSRQLNVKGGFYSMGNDFGGLPYVCNFNNNGNCGHPLGLLYGSGWLDSPTGGWGARVKWTEPSGWYAQLGAYDVTPARKRHSQGFNLDFSNTTGVIVPLEVGFVHGKTPKDYPGTYKIGAYYDSSTVSDVGDPNHLVAGRTGGYIQAAQQIWKTHPGALQGLSVFAVATLSDPQTGLFRTSYEAGLSWRDPLPGRNDDIVSFGWVQENINSSLRWREERLGKPGQTNEQLFEVNYGWQAAPAVLVRPALQYAVRPGGYSTRPDTFVFSAHFQVNF
jgi:porin